MEQWEYLHANDASEIFMNALGAQGWELVCVMNSAIEELSGEARKHQYGSPYQPRSRVTFIYKRRKR